VAADFRVIFEGFGSMSIFAVVADFDNQNQTMLTVYLASSRIENST